VGEPSWLRGERTAAAVLWRSGPIAGFWVLAASLLSAVLVPFGLWRPQIVWPLLVVAAAVSWWLARGVPFDAGPPVPVWTTTACVAVALGFVVWAAATHGEHVVVRRDAGSYALFAHWIATRHGLPVDADLDAFGGVAALHVPGFTFDSPAFYEVITGDGTGARVVPQFLLGAPALYSLGWWVSGWSGMFLVPALLGGTAVLAAAGLTARLVGPRWAPTAAAALALTQPVLHSARATFSEPPAMLLVLVAAALTVDAVRAPAVGAARRLGAAAGLSLGLAGLIRVDSVREVALVVPACAVLMLRRSPAGAPIVAGALIGTAVAAVPAIALSRPYLHTVSGSLRPLVYGTVALTVVTAAVVAAVRWAERRRAPTDGGPEPVGTGSAHARSPRLTRWIAASAAGGVLAVGVALATRPLWTVARQAADDPGDSLVASLQAQQGLRVDGARTYGERSVEWLVWYVGPLVTLAALLVAAILAWRAVVWWRTGTTTRRGPADVPGWLVPAVVAFGSVVLTLYRPGITPDHPWADRRLVVVVLPAVVIAATAAAAEGVRYTRRRMPIGVLIAAGVAAEVALLAPAIVATLPLAGARTEVGQPSAVATVCAALRPGDAVVAVSDAAGRKRAQNEWVQVIRGVCGRPGAAVLGPAGQQRAAVARVGPLVSAAGGRLVLLAAGDGDGQAPAALRSLGASPVRVVSLHTTEDQHLLIRRPWTTSGLLIEVWLAVWPGTSAR
jgi:hypothetical protein